MAPANDDLVARLLAEIEDLKGRVTALEDAATWRALAVAALRPANPALAAGREWEREISYFVVDCLSRPSENADAATNEARKALANEIAASVEHQY